MSDTLFGKRRLDNNVLAGKDVSISEYTNLYGCVIGDNTRIGPFVEIQKNVSIGSCCKISSHSFICEGVKIERGVFIGHGVMFTNDLYPKATTENGFLQSEADWKCIPTTVQDGASIGSGATILCGITIGMNSIIGAGSVVTHNVPPNSVVAGNPARLIRMLDSEADVPRENQNDHEDNVFSNRLEYSTETEISL
jgi:acetyltransferase-like isoleucine patch superfamily enzyme